MTVSLVPGPKCCSTVTLEPGPKNSCPVFAQPWGPQRKPRPSRPRVLMTQRPLLTARDQGGGPQLGGSPFPSQSGLLTQHSEPRPLAKVLLSTIGAQQEGAAKNSSPSSLSLPKAEGTASSYPFLDFSLDLPPAELAGQSLDTA
ncbi:hypothetical protein TREES_T100005089 [Tupaia chinensis]|uniref:Uncharacterized protein n=1 Tax=Tupaia chinensis TaxID=246437 RepID=L9L1I1_TUPCH|nr:hypothetical protein TREES_T100005089 [Tupaia chinensis]